MDKLEAIFCSNNKNATGRFIEAALLTLLNVEASYGYGLMESLGHLGFDRDSINSSIIYRNLRNMEKRGLITSTWQDSSQGPRKRIYEISPLGQDALVHWIELLDHRRKRLTAIIDFYDETRKR